MKELETVFVWAISVNLYKKIDGVGPIDNRPSTNQLHHFFFKYI